MISNRAEIIAISNQKGGVGKTSTANALAARLHDLGKSVLTIDMDPQGNLSASINADYDSGTILDVMRGKVPAKEAVQHKEPFDIIPANILLAGYEQELISSNFGRDIRLKKGIAPLLSEYEYIIIDTAPSLGMLTINSLVAADQVIVPAPAEYFATKGLEDFVDTIRNVQEYCGNPYLRIAGILFTLVSFFMVIFVFVRRLLFGDPVAGWASTICIILFIGGIQLLCMGIMGQYLAKTYLEVKRRPHYIIADSNDENAVRIR